MKLKGLVSVTLKEIAKMAGVSTATVSYVLNNTASVKEETKNRVLNIVKSTGYTSNSIAKSLRISKTKTIGIIVEDMTETSVPILIDGINEMAELRGYKTLLSNLRLLSNCKSKYDTIHYNKDTIKQAIYTLLGMQVDGIIYIATYDKQLDDILPPCQKPIVYCNCYGNHDNDISVTYNNVEASYNVTKQLIELGHSNIGLITGKMDTNPAKLRLHGYMKALGEFNIPVNKDYIKCGYWGYHKGKVAATELLTLDNRPTAIYAMNDNMAIGAYEAAIELDLIIPDHVSIFGFDNAETSRYIRPRMSTVNKPLKEIGMKSTESLLKVIDGETVKNKKTLLSCETIMRSSVSPNINNSIYNC